ncbi:MAG TPA: ABC transporter ATP-binding protein [Alphaproteobacteria bacterium]|nr:ABC transporter ATP-binding protein [Alphaproteobacteria bacterium]
MSALSVRGISKRFRGLQAVDDLSFDVPERAIVALIGPNGAGKTTTFNLIAGVTSPDSGDIRFGGLRLNGLPPHRVCAAGVARTFQIVRPFGELTLEDNVLIGCLRATSDVDRARDSARRILERLDMWTRRHQRAASLTLPDRKRLEVARALGTQPKLLLLDEVMAGLRPTETDQMVAFFREINRDLGVTILLIEHVMRAVMALAQRIVVLNYGKKIAEGTPEAVVRDPAVLDCYLGEETV